MRRAAAGITALVLAADQLRKSLVLAARPAGGSGIVSLGVVQNTGAGFGIGTGHPALVLASTVAVIAVVAVLLARTRSRPTALFLAVVLGGALGNLADRVFRSPGLGRSAVVDWIHVAGYADTFNLADIAIRAGAAALPWCCWASGLACGTGCASGGAYRGAHGMGERPLVSLRRSFPVDAGSRQRTQELLAGPVAAGPSGSRCPSAPCCSRSTSLTWCWPGRRPG